MTHDAPDASAVVSSLESLHGPLGVPRRPVPAPEPLWLRALRILGFLSFGAALCGLGYLGMGWQDDYAKALKKHQDYKAAREREDLVHRLSAELEHARRFAEDEQSEAGAWVAQRLAGELFTAKAQAAALGGPEKEPQPGADLFFMTYAPESALYRFAVRVVEIGAPAALILGSLLTCLVLFVVFIGDWLRNQIAQMSQNAVERSGAPLSIQTRDRSQSGNLLAPALAMSQAPLGGLASRAAVATGAVALTVGAFSLAIPGDSLTLDKRETRVAGGVIQVGQVAVDVPATTVRIDPTKIQDGNGGTAKVIDGRVVVDGTAKVSVPEFDVRFPPISIVVSKIGDEEIEKLRGTIEAEVRLVIGEVIKSSFNGQIPVGDGKQTIYTCDHSAEFLEEIRDRPTRDEFEMLKTQLQDAGDSATTLASSVATATINERQGTIVDAIESARDIRRTNRLWINQRFRPGLVRLNQEAYDRLCALFPEAVDRPHCTSSMAPTPLGLQLAADPPTDSCKRRDTWGELAPIG